MRIALSVVLLTLALASPATACEPFVEEHADWHTARLRPHSTAFEDCAMDEATYVRVVGEWLRARPAHAVRLDSLSLGRAVAHPWLSRHLAEQALNDPEWARAARGSSGAHNAYVSRLLARPDVLLRLDAAFAGSAYAVFAVSVEKVLIGPAADYAAPGTASRRRVPFDAQVWLRLRPRASVSGAPGG
jgi:hypothetical protein